MGNAYNCELRRSMISAPILSPPTATSDSSTGEKATE